MSLELEFRRKRRRRRVRIEARVRIKHVVTSKIVGDVGTFNSMFEKYGNSVEYWCADIPPERNAQVSGGWAGYRLHPEIQDGPGGSYHLRAHGRKKAWLDLEASRLRGRTVILVWNAGYKVKGMCDDCADCNRDGCTFHEKDIFDHADEEDMRLDGERR